ncbi:hypothetical protein Syun_006108 [Stephania yunnanensis]|uniref:Uncharacterized protein n=1 Tax=Stephania yunnanensis TaxID=152371 RepID=A0AAP0KXN9_9MAGN
MTKHLCSSDNSSYSSPVPYVGLYIAGATLEVNESPIEVHEERSRFVLKLICKLELLEDKVQWSFSEGYRVTRLIDPEAVEDIDDTENPILIPTPVEDQQVLDTTIEEV